MWKLAGAHIVSETIEGEVIVVNLLDGTYYSITGSGTVIWAGICEGYPKPLILQCLEAAFQEAPAELSDYVDAFTSRLAEEGLIQEPESDEQTLQHRELLDSLSNGAKKPFEESGFAKFSDMEDVLKMDPIHDFDESGWPNRR